MPRLIKPAKKLRKKRALGDPLKPEQVRWIESQIGERGWNKEDFYAAYKSANAERSLARNPERQLQRVFQKTDPRPLTPLVKANLARTLKMTVEEFESKLQASLDVPSARTVIPTAASQPPRTAASSPLQKPIGGSPAASHVLPIDHWPHFRWKVAGIERKPLPAKVYGLNRTSLRLAFEARRGLWLPGDNFADYEEFRKQTWFARQEKRKREGRNAEHDDLVWHVEQIALPTCQDESATLKLTVQRACYSDVVTTAQDPALQSPLGHTTVQSCLASAWLPGDPSLPFYPAANQLMVLLMLTTKDDKVLLARQGITGAGAKGLWANSVVGHVHGYDDNDNLERPDPTKTASREAKEEIGAEVGVQQVKWMALVVGLKYGSFSLHGEVNCDLTSEQILTNWFAKRSKPEEISEIKFVGLDKAAIAQRLEVRDYTNLCELGLGLCLWRRGLGEIACPSITDKWAFMASSP